MGSLSYDYTEGYPYMVSRICKLLDEKIAAGAEYGNLRPGNASAVWAEDGFTEGIKLLLKEPNTLFFDMQKNWPIFRN